MIVDPLAKVGEELIANVLEIETSLVLAKASRLVSIVRTHLMHAQALVNMAEKLNKGHATDTIQARGVKCHVEVSLKVKVSGQRHTVDDIGRLYSNVHLHQLWIRQWQNGQVGRDFKADIAICIPDQGVMADDVSVFTQDSQDDVDVAKGGIDESEVAEAAAESESKSK